jgi:hypothetical protein
MHAAPSAFPRWQATALIASFLLAAWPAQANNIGENAAWGFESVQEKAIRSTNLDLAERKKAGYYDSIKTIITNTTYINHQTNCSLSAAATGNSGSNGMSSYASSPVVTSSTSTSAGSSANGASNSALGAAGLSTAGGGVSNSQSNSGSLYSGVNSSATNGTTGAVAANGGRSSQVLNSQQTSSGTLTASVNGSSACSGFSN